MRSVRQFRKRVTIFSFEESSRKSSKIRRRMAVQDSLVHWSTLPGRIEEEINQFNAERFLRNRRQQLAVFEVRQRAARRVCLSYRNYFFRASRTFS
jgi:hypothetical protein